MLEKQHALRVKFDPVSYVPLEQKIQHAPRAKSGAPRRSTKPEPIRYAARGESWQPGRLHPNLSWTHYRTLLRVESADARSFYEIEAIENNWTARELERQINSVLFERLAKRQIKRTGPRRRVGYGHLYQGRHKSFPIEGDEHFYQVVRYVHDTWRAL